MRANRIELHEKWTIEAKNLGLTADSFAEAVGKIVDRLISTPGLRLDNAIVDGAIESSLNTRLNRKRQSFVLFVCMVRPCAVLKVEILNVRLRLPEIRFRFIPQIVTK